MRQNRLKKLEVQQRAKQVVRDYSGILPPYRAFYIESILYASGRSIAAFSRFSAAVEVIASDTEIVASAHEALGHAAALSRLFFSSDKIPLAHARASTLRKIFSVGDNSPLADRELRNALEHFDERLDAYLLHEIAGVVLPGPIVDDADLADEELGHVFRLVDPKTETFVLFGSKHKFGNIRREVERIAVQAEAMG